MALRLARALRTSASRATVQELSVPVQKQPPAKRAVAALKSVQDVEGVRSVALAFAQTNSQFGHASFVNAAVDRLDELGAKGDLPLYNDILSVFPERNNYKTGSLLDAIWPKDSVHSDAALRVLDRMEDRGIIPETRTHEAVLRSFGRASLPVKKVRAMAYWMRRYIAMNPFALPETLPAEASQRALLFLKRMSDAPATALDLSEYADDTDKAVAAYSQSAQQRELVLACSSAKPESVQWSVRGVYPVWMRKERHFYITLIASHSQLLTREVTLGTAVCLKQDGTSAGPSDTAWPLVVQAWMDTLEATFPALAQHRVLLRLGEGVGPADLEKESRAEAQEY